MMIFNRTQSDVDAAKEIREQKVKKFLTLDSDERITLERGMLTINTLNRIENKQTELKAILNGIGYFDNEISNKTWQLGDVFTSADFQRIIDNENTLRNSFYTYSDTPNTPNISFGFEDINALEKILYDLESLIDKTKSVFIYSSSDVYSGGV